MNLFTNEYYETPASHTAWLHDELRQKHGGGIHGRAVFEPCVGRGAIVEAIAAQPMIGVPRGWIRNDIDPRWSADLHGDASTAAFWADAGETDWTITNPAFSIAVELLHYALQYSSFGVALYLRASIHEPLKTGPRRAFLREHPPTGILWLPRFAYRRSRTKGTWTTDSVTTAWCIWDTGAIRRPQYIAYAPESVLLAQEAETPIYRARMDALLGYTGTEADRQAQAKADGACPKAGL